ncbi:hypothetical protein OG787_32655 [Streptomyces sp. NBC_00075]|uniref:Uncharacterized protein n=1 Tax=Streptomyces sp. NBC_00093 TaxID=2975649 RepID=A0AAU2A5F9_9ACTN
MGQKVRHSDYCGNRVTGQRDATGRRLGPMVVVDLKSEHVEETPRERLGHRGEVDRNYWQLTEKPSVRRFLNFGFQSGELPFQIQLLAAQLGAPVVDVANEFPARIVDEFQVPDEALAPGLGLLDRRPQRHSTLPPFTLLVRVQLVQTLGEQIRPVLAEDLRGQEFVDAVEQARFRHPNARRMLRRAVRPFRGADVVANPFARLAVEASAALHTEHVAAQPVAALRLRMPAQSPGGSRALAMASDLLGLHERLQTHQRLVGRLGGPHPLFHRVGTVATRTLAGATVPHHVAGVLRVGQDVADVGVRPVPDCRIGQDGRRWRVGHQIQAEPIRDRLVTQALHNSPLEHLLHDQAFDQVDYQQSLLDALGPLRGHGMRDGLPPVPVTRLSDVVAVLGVHLEACPRLLQQLSDVPLGHSLLDPSRQDLGGRLGLPEIASEVDRLVGGEQRQTGLLQLIFDLGAEVRVACDSVDRLADHRVESAVRTFRLL